MQMTRGQARHAGSRQHEQQQAQACSSGESSPKAAAAPASGRGSAYDNGLPYAYGGRGQQLRSCRTTAPKHGVCPRSAAVASERAKRAGLQCIPLFGA
jgi:hypothetical protein